MARTAWAHAEIADGDPQAAVEELAPVLAGSVASSPLLLVEAFLIDAIAQDTLGDKDAAESDIERALELAEPDGLIWPFVITPVRNLLERHPRHRTAHGALLKNILGVIAGSTPRSRATDIAPLDEELSESELRVLRYLPSNLSAPDIGRELYPRSTPSRRTSGTSTPSSASTAAQMPLSALASWGCSRRPPRAASR